MAVGVVLSQCVEGKHDACVVEVEVDGVLAVCMCECHGESEDEIDHI